MTPSHGSLLRRCAMGATAVALIATWSTSAGSATAPSRPGAGSFTPPTSGSVAALAPSSMEVQNPQTGQTTVEWTSTTTFSQVATVPASTVVVGDCVTVTGSPTNGSLTARTVSVSQSSSSGTCTGFGQNNGSGGAGGFGRFRGPRPGGSGSFGANRPNRNFRPGANFANFGFATGKVTAVGSGTLTLNGFSSLNRPARTSTSKGSSAKKTQSKASTPKAPTASTFQVHLSSSTTFSEVQPASPSSLAVGDCVTAVGPAATNGTVTASTVRITSTGGQSCSGGFGFSGRFGPGGPPPSVSSV